jgi:chromosome segregation ATPase
MAEEISLDKQTERVGSEEERGFLGNLEEKIGHLLIKYQELLKERDELAAELDGEREKRVRLEKKMEFLSQDREKVKTRIDQLLHRLKSVDI